VAVLPRTVAERFAQLFAVQSIALREDWARRQYLVAVQAQPVLPPPLRHFIDLLSPNPENA